MSKGYGVSSLETKAAMDANTLFGIASNTKAFTAAALGLLVEEGKLRWDDKVTIYIPEFQLYDPYVTAEFTVRDLLCHRSGLGLGAGDLMLLPDSADFTIKDVIHNLRYFKPVSSFRSQYDYDNNLYLVAGEVVARIVGPALGRFCGNPLLRAAGHEPQRYPLLPPTRPDQRHRWPRAGGGQGAGGSARSGHGQLGPAGGMYSSVADMSKWALMLLGGPGAPASLLKPATQHELWSPQTILRVAPAPAVPSPYSYNTHFAAYGLGWFLRDVRGYKEVSHTAAKSGW